MEFGSGLSLSFPPTSEKWILFIVTFCRKCAGLVGGPHSVHQGSWGLVGVSGSKEEQSVPASSAPHLSHASCPSFQYVQGNMLLAVHCVGGIFTQCMSSTVYFCFIGGHCIHLFKFQLCSLQTHWPTGSVLHHLVVTVWNILDTMVYLQLSRWSTFK